jgi:uncharacterized protein with PIN domain
MMDDLKERLRANGLDECDEAIDRIEAHIAKVREKALREALDAAREYRYRRGEAVENAILALIEKDQ